MNQPVRRGPIAAFFVGLWNVMNFTRRLILNVLFFGLLFLFLVIFVAAMGGMMASGKGGKPLDTRTTLVIAPEGRLVEQFSVDPIRRALARARSRFDISLATPAIISPVIPVDARRMASGEVASRSSHSRSSPTVHPFISA